jgi:hypothetical protein
VCHEEVHLERPISAKQTRDADRHSGADTDELRN